MKRLLAILFRLALLILVVAALAVAGRALIARKRAALAAAPTFELKARPVDTVDAYMGDLAEGHQYLAVVEPLRTAAVAARITATIERVQVREGDRVKEGDLLVSLDDRQFQNSLATMAAQIAQAQADLAGNEASAASLKESALYWQRERERDGKLAAGGTIPSAQAEATAEKANEAQGKLAAATQKSASLEQQVQALQRKADEVRTTLTYCRVVSPFAGVVTVKEIDPGDLATPGRTLLVVEDRASVKLAFAAPQGDLPAFRVGLDASFVVDGQSRKAVVSRVYPSLNRARMVRAEVVLSGVAATDLSLGAYVDVTVVFRRRENATLVPVEALVPSPTDEQRVFIVQDGVLQVRPVTVQGTACNVAAVTGVEVGERVVVSSFLGWARLAAGMKVETR